MIIRPLWDCCKPNLCGINTRKTTSKCSFININCAFFANFSRITAHLNSICNSPIVHLKAKRAHKNNMIVTNWGYPKIKLPQERYQKTWGNYHEDYKARRKISSLALRSISPCSPSAVKPCLSNCATISAIPSAVMP